MSQPKHSPSLTPIVARMEALMERARRPDLRPGDLDEPVITELNEIRALLIDALATESAASSSEADFSPSGLPTLPSCPHAKPGKQTQTGEDAGRSDRL